ncbi:hypothetical protein H4R33_001877 [Dimargaris cristalligena]|nr:hypothetical protein H4R33_001877 [Dimargaris cristalligena]
MLEKADSWSIDGARAKTRSWRQLPWRKSDDNLSSCGNRGTLEDWWGLLYHQFAGSLFIYTNGDWGTEIKSLKDDAVEHRYFVELSRFRHLYTFLKNNRQNPYFQKGVWGFVNPNEMLPSVLAHRLPLLTLVDVQSDGRGVLKLLGTLTNPVFVELAQREWAMGQDPGSAGKHRRLRELMGQVPEPSDDQDPSQVFTRLFYNTAAIMMARLAMTQRFDNLKYFVENLGHAADKRSRLIQDVDDIGIFQRLAIVLAAVARQEKLLISLPDSHIIGSFNDEPTTALSVKCSLVGVMREIGLPRGAVFLNQVLGCAKLGHSQLYQSLTWNLGHCFKYIDQLRLTDDGIPQMGIAVLLPEFRPHERNGLTNMDPWPHYQSLWDFDSHALNPKFYDQVRHVTYAGYRRYGYSNQFVKMPDLLLDQIEVPPDF